jgi:hypothetical protein
MKCPKHIDGFVCKLPKKNKFIDCDSDDYHIAYLVKCNCGCEVFKVFINEMPSVILKCNNCDNQIIVYDLKFYPAATIIPGNEKFEEYISLDGDLTFNICVIYEYSELDEGEKFNPDDITWCEVYAYGVKSKKVFEIINDETA